MSNFYRIQLYVNLDTKLSLKQIEKISKKFGSIRNYEKSVDRDVLPHLIKFSGNEIEIDISKTHTFWSHRKIVKVISYLEKFIDYSDVKQIGSIYSSQTDRYIELFAYKNKLYFSQQEDIGAERKQTIISMNGGSVTYTTREKELQTNINISLAHFTLNQ